MLQDFSGQNIQGCSFKGEELTEANFSHAEIVGVNFSHACLSDADFSHSQIAGANFSHACLSNANFNHAQIAGVDFSYASLDNASFSYADIRGISFNHAYITNTHFTQTSILSSDFSNTCIVDANLSNMGRKVSLAKLAILSIVGGSFEQGFSVILQIYRSAKEFLVAEIGGELPPSPDIIEHYKQWKNAYKIRTFNLQPRILKPVAATNISIKNTRAIEAELVDSLNRWLNSDSFRRIQDNLLAKLTPDEEINVMIKTSNHQLRCIPWNSWNFFDHYPYAELSLSLPTYEYEPAKRSSCITNKYRVRILSIFGDSSNINLEEDRRLLETLPDAEIVILGEPKRQELSDHLWDERGWDILFFAGHSSTHDQIGKIYINPYERLTIEELKHGLRKAIQRGLQLAIFNSCDGLGLASQLASLNIPQVIVMREDVPDVVAQEFLKYFLKAFANGKSLYLAVREARERLQGLEDKFPGASWLPVICQNSAEIPLTWQELCGKINNNVKYIHPPLPIC